jgi:hypothetical protein
MERLDRLRQLVGEMLVYCFAVVLITGGFLAVVYTPGGETMAYDGSYEPLRGVMMSSAYESALKISWDVRGGLFMRQIHYQATILLALGVVAWIALGRGRYALAVLGLVLLGGLGGFGAADDLLWGTFLGKLPSLWWYALHLVAALAVIAALVVSARREAARQPRTLRFMALAFCLSALLFWL